MDKANSVTDNGISSLSMAYSTLSSSRPPYQNPSAVREVRSSTDGAMTTMQMTEHTMCDVAHWAFFALYGTHTELWQI